MAPETTSAADEPALQPDPQKHSLGARLLAALGFGLIGAKLGVIGTGIDAHRLLKSEGLDWGALGSKAGRKAIQERLGMRILGMLQKEGKTITRLSIAHASMKIMPYTWITTGVFVGIGSVLGWVRGGLIADGKDIFKHPWRSTKIILGFEKPPGQEQPATDDKQAAQKETPDDTGKWAKQVQSRQSATQTIQPRVSRAEAAAQADASSSVALGA